jgi:hypothetical protein
MHKNSSVEQSAMQELNSTPAFVSQIYADMRHSLRIVRQRLKRRLSLADKALLCRLTNPDQQELTVGRSYLQVRPDRLVLQDVLGQLAMLPFIQTGKTRLDLLDLAALRAGEPITCVVRHANGTQEIVQLDHTYSAAQIAWFRAGSALNLVI